MRIADVMTRDLPTVAPESTVREAARCMTQTGIKALPVCENGRRLVGIITDWDVARATAEEGDPGEQALREYMSTDLVAVGPDAQLTEAAVMMGERRVHHLLVRDGDELAGMIHLDVEWSDMGGPVETPTATFAARI
jgi:CBS domain-containing protein